MSLLTVISVSQLNREILTVGVKMKQKYFTETQTHKNFVSAKMKK